MKKILLYSAGFDSWLIDKLWKPTHKIFLRIGTESNEQEYKIIKKQLDEGKLSDIEIIDYPLVQFEEPHNNYYLPLRNLHLILMASHFADEDTEICIGSVKGSVHKDNNSEFAKLTTKLINYLYTEQGKQKVKVVVPFENTGKTELLRMYIQKGGKIEDVWNNTFSCYKPKEDGTECYVCTSCLSKIAAFYFNNFNRFPKTVETRYGKKEFFDLVMKSIEKNMDRVERDVLLMYTSIHRNGEIR